MNAWKTAALCGALLTAAGGGAALTPQVHAQGARVAAVRAPVDVQVWVGGSRLGVTVRDVSDEDGKRGRHGVVVEQVQEDGAAAKAGFKVGDIITEFDGERVRSVRQFTRLVQETVAGRNVTAAVLRDGQKTTLTVEPREGGPMGRSFEILRDFDFDNFARFERLPIPARPARPPSPPSPRSPASPSSPPVPPVPPTEPLLRNFESFALRSGTTLGIGISDLSPQLAEYFGTKDGVLVTSVTENSAAAKAGVKAGDVITAVNGAAVNDPSDLRREIQRLGSNAEFTLSVVRDKKTITLKGKTEERETRRGRVVL